MYSSYKSLINISSVRSRFFEKVGVWKVAFSPLISFTSRKSRRLFRFWKRNNGNGQIEIRTA